MRIPKLRNTVAIIISCNTKMTIRESSGSSANRPFQTLEKRFSLLYLKIQPDVSTEDVLKVPFKNCNKGQPYEYFYFFFICNNNEAKLRL